MKDYIFSSAKVNQYANLSAEKQVFCKRFHLPGGLQKVRAQPTVVESNTV